MCAELQDVEQRDWKSHKAKLERVSTIVTRWGGALSILSAVCTGIVSYMLFRVDRVEQKVETNSLNLAVPRYTLDQSNERMEARDKVHREERREDRAEIFGRINRHEEWMAEYDEFRRNQIRTQSETSADIREIKTLLLTLKEKLDRE